LKIPKEESSEESDYSCEEIPVIPTNPGLSTKVMILINVGIKKKKLIK
jgi:hypothetical protein